MSELTSWKRTIQSPSLTLFSGSLAFVFTGYALAFGEGNAFLGHTYFAAIDLPRSKFTHLFFQVRRSFISIHLIPPHEKWSVHKSVDIKPVLDLTS